MRAQLLTKGVKNVDENDEMLESFQKDQKERRVLRTPLSWLRRVSQVLRPDSERGHRDASNGPVAIKNDIDMAENDIDH